MNAKMIFHRRPALCSLALVPLWFGILVTAGFASTAAGEQVSQAPGDAPGIIEQPISRTASVGGHVVLSVAATGTTPLSFHWVKDGQLLANATNVFGATASVLNIDPVTTNNAGAYAVVITNMFGAATSTVASITVNPVALQLTVISGGLILRVTGPIGDVYRIEGSANPTGPWAPYTYLTNRSGSVQTSRTFAQLPNYMQVRFDHMLPILYPPHPSKLDASTRIYGKLNQIWRVQKTSNFLQWAEHSVVTNTNGWVRLIDDVDTHRFYRVIPP